MRYFLLNRFEGTFEEADADWWAINLGCIENVDIVEKDNIRHFYSTDGRLIGLIVT